MLLWLSPLALAIHSTQPQDPQPQPEDPDLPLRSQPIAKPRPKPPQAEPIPTQADSVAKVSAFRREVWRVSREEEDDAWATRVCGYTMQGIFFALL
jgi:hypothetical protein